MRSFLSDTKPMANAALASGIALLAFLGLTAAGLSANLSLFAGLGVAGLLNIRNLSALNPDVLLPTSGTVVGEH